jgi:transposase-like protein
MEITLTAVCAVFPTNEDCLRYLEEIMWNGKPICSYCKSRKHSRISKGHRYHCNSCNLSYSVTVNTIFESTHVDLRKWFFTIALLMGPDDDPSARKLASEIGVDKNTACFLNMRIRINREKEFILLRKIADEVTRRLL